MSTTKKTYTLGKIKQLIDLNGDSVNFDLTFNVTGKDNSPFSILVVDQTTLDNSPELQYKEANGTMSGNIVADKNVYQNYFLILKSDTPCQVDVELIKKELPRTPDPPPNKKVISVDTSENWFSTKTIMIVVSCLIAVVLLYYMYNKKEENSKPSFNIFNSPRKDFNEKEENNFIPSIPLPLTTNVYKPSLKPERVISSPVLSSRSSIESHPRDLSLLNRLNQLHGKVNKN